MLNSEHICLNSSPNEEAFINVDASLFWVSSHMKQSFNSSFEYVNFEITCLTMLGSEKTVGFNKRHNKTFNWLFLIKYSSKYFLKLI